MDCPNCPGNDEWYGTMCVGCGWSPVPEWEQDEDEYAEWAEAEYSEYRNRALGNVDTGKLAINFIAGLIAGFLGL